MMHAIAIETMRDYGIQPTPAGVRYLRRATRPPRKIDSPGAYVAVCRALAGRGLYTQGGTSHPLDGEDRIDGRLVAVGYQHETPTQWVEPLGSTSRLEAFLEYWERVARYPRLVGSPANPDPMYAYRAWRRGIPASITRAVPQCAGRPGPIYPVRPRELLRLRRQARAARRLSIRGDVYMMCSGRLLEALGRLCPELQSVAVGTLREDDAWIEAIPRGGCRVKDVDWAAVSRAQAEIVADPSARADYATGRRRAALLAASSEPTTE